MKPKVLGRRSGEDDSFRVAGVIFVRTSVGAT